ncbi:LysR family transcriptional regulator ArgP [Rhodobacter capsulatus]|uniref:LysR family transcriptional regulator ArgP n=1 Tax=Rhodobacter capsulatus TaxID=1061 RepID=UPI0006DD034A|nr:LysR family transcriptional regulator ArgP [Rhodobacter capsulatus]KQB11472.1 LysR family transcriptional regulator [Rhodobacter capsulatus]KQB12325.1 LysR family transcriptional regulator [Rhodobacter capsulatus]PZX25815.1 LysR family transcriptional regulator (chromosome initiation inhibitor) [Rhodobacter capsulatus]QNR64116.1 LysR family transcriptional regulator ArgP [Rhodobacter capsulatus]
MLDYPLLAALAAVIREGGFDRAAAVLGVTPSAVSQRIRALEDRVGAALVVRSQPPVPTETGARLCAHVERVRLLEGELAADLPGLAGQGPPALPVAVNADSLGSWFLPAAARFSEATGALLHLLLDDEEHTAARLRSGEVLAAVTADPAAVPGCRTRPLGALRYVACASPAFMARHFPQGVTAAALARAPVLQFDRKDGLQARWLRRHLDLPLAAPTHQLPSTQGFLDACLLGLGWALNPLPLAAAPLAEGRLVELLPGAALEVPLHWQHVRLGARLLEALTREVAAEARRCLIPPDAGIAGLAGKG